MCLSIVRHHTQRCPYISGGVFETFCLKTQESEEEVISNDIILVKIHDLSIKDSALAIFPARYCLMAALDRDPESSFHVVSAGHQPPALVVGKRSVVAGL